MRRIAAALLFALSLARPSFAQEGNASLTGFIQDSSKAVIPDVRVLAINTDTNEHFEATTNKDGSYNIASLPVGPYRMQIEKPGFRTILKEGIFLHTQDVLQVNFQMAVGSTDETVTVSGDSANINTNDASVSTVIDRQFAENLPMNGRTFQTLIYLTPGVTLNSGPGQTSGQDTGQFSINGQRTSSNYWMVDGVSANIGVSPWGELAQGLGGGLGAFNVLGGTNSLVSVDAMQEFRIQTSTYAPEFGRTPGGQISIVTRSGTNQFHGTLFDYFRNTVLDAEDWFADRNDLGKAAEQQNDFGGVLGGRLIKDRTFFFFSYEGLRLRLPQSALTTVPDLAVRQKAASDVQPFLNAYPQPNPGAPDDCPESSPGCGYAPFNASFSNPAKVNVYSLRLDHSLAKSLNLFGRFNYSPSNYATRAGGFTANTISTISNKTTTGTAGATWTTSAQAVNDFRFNYSYSGGHIDYNMDSFGGGNVAPLAALLPSPYTTRDAIVVVVPLVGANMLYGVGKWTGNSQHQYNVVDSLSVQRGTHSLKLGVDYRRLSPNYSPTGYQSDVLFSALQDFEQGSSESTILNHEVGATFLYHNLSLFVQDAWRINPRVTMTYGLRWDVDFVPTVKSGPRFPAITGFSSTDLSSLALAPVGTAIYRTPYGNVAPRVGGAYQISQSPSWGLVLRSGFGVFYDLVSTQVGSDNINYYPYDAAKIIAPVPFPTPLALSAPPSITPPSATQGTLFGYDPHLNSPYSLEWSLALEQALGKAQTLTISYLGSSGKRLPATETIANPNQNYLTASLVGNAGHSDYGALQLQFQRRMSRGLQALASYTWGHSIDTGSYAAYTDGTFANINANKGDSDFDIRNTFSVALSYIVPGKWNNAVVNELLGRWSTENVVQMHSGPPVTVIDGAFTALTTTNSSTEVRPDLVPDQPLYLHGSLYPGRKALNPDAFAGPPTVLINGVATPTRQGDLGRNALRGFGLSQWDFAVHRDFPLHDAFQLQFRAEMFNILNHPNFASYNSTFGTNNPYFGQSTQMFGQGLASTGGVAGNGGLNAVYQLGSPRSIQLALKLVF